MAEAVNNESVNDDKKTPGTRVFKKSCPNAKITVYVEKRDFIDHNGQVDPIDGVILVEPDCIDEGSDKKVFVQVLAAFRHGREDLDVLGLSFRKDLYEDNLQICPLPRSAPRFHLTKLQERLIRKLGASAHPFTFKLPGCIPSSVTLQPEAGSTTKPCGIDYELRAFVAHSPVDKPEKKNSVRLGIKKLTHASNSPSDDQPTAEVSKSYLMGSSTLHVEATLDKRMYCHGEDIKVNLTIHNRTGRTVRKIKISARQFAEICLFSTAQYRCVVDVIESDEHLRIGQGDTFHETFTLCPTLQKNRDKRGLALDGQLRHEDTNLASSTVVDGHVPTSADERQRLGIVVEYRIKIRCVVQFGSDVTLELPFILSHPKPHDAMSPIQGISQSNPRVAMRSVASGAVFTLTAPILGIGLNATGLHGSQPNDENIHGEARPPPEGELSAEARPPPEGELSAEANPVRHGKVPTVVEGTLILVDDAPADDEDEDDLIFEEFVRSRAVGESDA